MSNFIGQVEIEKKKKMKIYKRKEGWARSGYLDPSGVPTLGKYKDLKSGIQKNKNLAVVKIKKRIK